MKKSLSLSLLVKPIDDWMKFFIRPGTPPFPAPPPAAVAAAVVVVVEPNVVPLKGLVAMGELPW